MYIQPGIVIKAKTNDSLFVATNVIKYPDQTKLYDIDPMDPTFADNWKLLYNRTYQLKGEQFLINLLFRLIILTGGVIREAKFNKENDKYLEIFRNRSMEFHDSINLNEDILPVKVKICIDNLHNLIVDCKNSLNRDASIFRPLIVIGLRLKYRDIGLETARFADYIVDLENVLFDNINLYKGLNLSNLEGIANKDTEIKYEPLPSYFNERPEVKSLIPFNAVLQKNNKTELYVTKETIFSDELSDLNSTQLRGEKFRSCYRLYIKVLSAYGGFIREFIHKRFGILGFGSVDNTEALKNIVKNPKTVNTFNVIDPTSIAVLILNLLNGIKTVYPSLMRSPSFKRIPENTTKYFTTVLIKIEYDLNDMYLHSGIGDVNIMKDVAIDFMKEHYDKKPPYDIEEEKANAALTKKIFDGTNKIDLLEPIVNELGNIAFDERDVTSIYGGNVFSLVLSWSFILRAFVWFFVMICIIILIYVLYKHI